MANISAPAVMPGALAVNMDGSYGQSLDTSTWNWDDKSSDAIYILIVTFLMLITMIPTASTRIVHRYRTSNFGVDDVFLIFALTSALCLLGFGLLAYHLGLGQHIWNLVSSGDDVNTLGKRLTVTLLGCYMSYALSMAFTKLSMIASLCRVYLGDQIQPDRLLRIILWFMTAIVSCTLLAQVVGGFLECLPIAAIFDWSIPGKCINILAFFSAMGWINLVTDLALLGISLWQVWATQLPRHKKFRLTFVFGFGAFACCASAIRLRFLDGLVGQDIFFTATKPLLWSIGEVCSAIICTSIPPIHTLLLKYARKTQDLFFGGKQVSAARLPSHAAHTAQNAHSILPATNPVSQGMPPSPPQTPNLDYTKDESASGSGISIPLRDLTPIQPNQATANQHANNSTVSLADSVYYSSPTKAREHV